MTSGFRRRLYTLNGPTVHPVNCLRLLTDDPFHMTVTVELGYKYTTTWGSEETCFD